MVTAEQKARRVVQADPAQFALRVMGATLYDKQQEMVRGCFSQPRVSVAGCNGSGKDFAAAHVIWTWLCLCQPSKVIVIAPTWRQVDDIIWNEIRVAYENKAVSHPWGFRVYGTPRIVSERNPAEHFAVGFATAERTQDREGMPSGRGLQGYHSPNLLVVISEAHAVPQTHIDALRRLNPKCMLLTGNPFSSSGEFYDSHHSRRDLYHAIQIAAEDTPNFGEGAPYEGWPEYPGMVSKADADARAAEWGADSPLFIAGVLGQFPDNMEGGVVPLQAAQEAVHRTAKPEGRGIVACDVARSGADKTVIIRRRGLTADILHRAQGHDTMRTAGELARIWRDLKPDAIIVDEVGLGAGVVDRLREQGIPIIAFNGGRPAWDKTRYSNMNAECWWTMRRWFMEHESSIPDDSALIGQVTARQYTIQSDSRIKLESKDDIKGRGLKSPDEGDALAMTFVVVPPDEDDVYVQEERVAISPF